MNKILFTAAVLGILLAGCKTCFTKQEPVKTSVESAAATVQPAETAEEAAVREQKAAAEKLKESLTKGESVSVSDNQLLIDSFGAPYAKYRLETGDMEIWFYDNFYLVFDRNIVSLKDYEVTIPASN